MINASNPSCWEKFNTNFPNISRQAKGISNIALISGIVSLILGVAFCGVMIATNPNASFPMGFSTNQIIYYSVSFGSGIIGLTTAAFFSKIHTTVKLQNQKQTIT
jgi:hypothetical protein